MPAGLEEPGKTVPEQDLVLGDHNPHGNSAVTIVPRPRGLSTLTLPPRAATRSVMPNKPEPRSAGAADAVITDADDEASVAPTALTATSDARACLAAFVSASLATK